MSAETNWKGILTGLISGLVVTVVGGAILFYAFQSPAPPPSESLIYEVGVPITFKSERNEISFTQIKIRNAGSAEATNVNVGIEFPINTKVTDSKVALSSGPVEKYNPTMESGNSLRFRIPSLTPDEIATVTILTNSISDKSPDVGVKSDKTTAVQSTSGTLGFDAEAPTGLYGQWVALALYALSLSGLTIFAVRRIRRVFPTFRSVNDTAFVYLHTGLVDQAFELLSDGTAKAGAQPIMLSNLGLAFALKGDTERAEKLFYAANFWADANKHERAVIAFNRALSHFWQQQDTDGVTAMRNALALSRTHVVRYLKFSGLVAALRDVHPDLHSLLDELSVSRDVQKKALHIKLPESTRKVRR